MMTNKEKYKKAFSVLHASDTISLEVNKMNKFQKALHMKTAVAACLCLLLLMGGVTAYAADVGGIQEIVHIWIHGEQMDAQVNYNEDGSMEFTLDTENGEDVIGAGGVEIGMNGEERALSPEEIAESMNEDITEKDDGTVWLYYYSHAINITDYIVDGTCKLALDDNGNMIYYDVEKDSDGGYGYTTSNAPTGAAEDYIVVK